MADRPLLVFPAPATQQREKGSGGRTPLQTPTWAKQKKRLAPQFKELEKAFSQQTPKLKPSLAGAPPEQVIVFETAGPVENFIRNVRKIVGMEWLVEQVEELEPDDNFFLEREALGEDAEPLASEKSISGRLFLVMSNQQALEELLARWKLYAKSDERFPYREGRWKTLFSLLKTVRTWNANDRLHPDLIEDWQLREKEAVESVRVEVELWHRASSAARELAFARLAQLVAAENGKEISRTSIPDIAYSAMLIELPIDSVKQILKSRDAKLVRSGDVMFFRPGSQLATASPAEIDGEIGFEKAEPTMEKPIVALLDGLPLEQHEALSGRLVVDDPDDWSPSYPANARVHGTAMASLILRGDLHSPGAVLSQPLLVRPVLCPSPAPAGAVNERMPADVLPVDLIHRAVRRIFEADGKEKAVAPSVRIINFSVGDRSRLFDNQMSPLARLLDWLSAKYNVLFVVSAGNHLDEHPEYLTLDIASAKLGATTPRDVERSTLRALVVRAHERRLLSPAEAMNALTVGAWQYDSGGPNTISTIRELVSSSGCPSPLNALGLGYGRSIKPDILAPGGRAHYKPAVMQGSLAQFSIVKSERAPGCRVASPGSGGSIRGYANSCGTSNAAALTTREAALLLGSLKQLALPDGNVGEAIADQQLPLVLRALLVHTAKWGEAREIVASALGNGLPAHILKQHLARLLGYGAIEPDRVRGCTDQRATAIAVGEIAPGEGRAYSLPLPADLAGQKVWRRLTVTLAWLSPVNPETRAYRQIKLWLDPPRDELRVKRFADDRMVRRGTIQHEVLEGDEASVFGAGETLGFVVNCEKESETKGPIPYALVTSLEVAPGEKIRVYEQVRDGIRALVKVPAKVAATP